MSEGQDGGTEEHIDVTEEQFELFRFEMLLWMQQLGLSDWKLYFIHGGTEERALAEVEHEYYPYCDRNVTVRFATKAPRYGLEPENIKRCAFHEVCEILLLRFYGMACSRWGIDPHELEEERHAIIRRLENAFWATAKPNMET